MKTLRLLLPLTLVSAAVAAAPQSYQEDIDTVFADLRTLASMKSGTHYTLPAGGKKLTGDGDDFLRRRTADEISASGLSCGCGDYAFLFIERIRARGFEPLLIDSAQISYASLASTNSGHAVVAIRPKDDPAAPWWLVDSTARKIISRDWSPDTPTFTASGYVYWIGYCGPVENYPVHSPEGLRRFYRDTLAKVPRDFFNRTIPQLVFTIDSSLKGRNPNLNRLRTEQERILDQYHIQPEQKVSILVVAGDDDASGTLNYVTRTASGGNASRALVQTDDQWVARLGLRAACSPNFLTYCQQKIRLAAP